MLKRYWREALASVVLAAVMLVIFALAGSFSHYQPRQNHYYESYASDSQVSKVDSDRISIIGRNLDWISAGITALATAAIAWFTFSLRDATKEQGRLTRESIDEAKKSSERQLRAYVLNSAASLFDGNNFPNSAVNRANQAAAALTIKNYGQTPAYQVRHRAGIDVAPVTDENRMSIPLDSMGAGNFVIGPEGTATANRWLDRPITPQERAGILNGTHAIYAYGRVEYLDAFNRHRWSTYRLQYSGSAWPPIGTESMGMDFCAGGNDAD